MFYKEAPFYSWHGKRLLSIDGTRLLLPHHSSIVSEFGQHNMGPNADSPRSLATGSVLYDCLNLLALDSQIASYNTSERDLLLRHLDSVREGDLLLLDRGYPCFWLLFLLTAKKIDFCVRLKENWWLKVNEFSQSSDTDRLVTFTLPKKDYQKLEAFPEIQNQAITCRLVKVKLPSGETEILCTSLTNQETYLRDELESLYHQRWNEEEGYKLLKARVEVEQFSGKTAVAVQQDFHAKLLLLTLTAVYAHPIEERVRKEFKADEKRKHDQKINRTNAISNMQKILTPIFLKNMVSTAIEYFDYIVANTRELIRRNRKNPRKHKPKRNYNMNYKPL